MQSTWNLGTNPLAKVSLELEGCLEKAENKERRWIHMVSMVSTAKANQDIRVACPSCNYEPLKSVTHKFWQCLRASKLWETAFNIIFLLNSPPHSNHSWRVLDLEECLYSKKVPGRIRRFSTVWSLLRGVSLTRQ